MNWMETLSRAIHYIENNLTNKLSVDDVSNKVHSSSSNFQRIFNLVTSMTIGDYIRNRRLSMAGQELLYTKSKVIDVAMRYQYDTSESFSKAFTRFHGVPPSKVRRGKIRLFSPLSINITIKGGFELQEYLFYDDYRKRKDTLETKKCKYCLRRVSLHWHICPWCKHSDFSYNEEYLY